MSAPAQPPAAAAATDAHAHAAPSPLSPSSTLLSAPRWSVWLASGAAAGLSVDLVLFPLDTIKTRMQSKQGLRASGGFAKLFAGVASAAAGSGQRGERENKSTNADATSMELVRPPLGSRSQSCLLFAARS